MTHQLAPKRKIFVGLSGGVDSSVAAALLAQEGYEVVGVFIKVWQPDFLECTWPEDRLDAMRVCAALSIPFKTYDLSDDYKREVVDYMLREYRLGRTPNPDVMCNTHIKFDSFLKRARAEGADMIATGHYVQQRRQKDVSKLYTAADKEKDQSYFLWGLSQEVLRYTAFPIGSYQKSEVRALAKRLNLPTATKRDSQGLCFLGKLDMHDFLSHFFPPKPGAVLDEQGRDIGTHDGAIFYTLGQRHGFKHTGVEALYVVAKDVERNTITVSPQKAISQAASSSTLKIHAVNWIAGPPVQGENIWGRGRYREPLRRCRIEKVSPEGEVYVHLDKKDHSLAAGQSFVFYREWQGGGEYSMVGGGIIEES